MLYSKLQHLKIEAYGQTVNTYALTFKGYFVAPQL